jgi:hypothetical protein
LMLEPDQPSPAHAWDRDASRRALDELFTLARQYNSSGAYLELMRFVTRFHFYSPFNAMLIHTQMNGAKFVATPHRWNRDYRRSIKAGAQPIVILQPMGPVMFVFDVTDTVPLPGAPPLPRRVEHPFEVRHGCVGNKLAQTIDTARRDGIRVSERAFGSQRAGSIQGASTLEYLDALVNLKAPPRYEKVRLQYELILNSNLSAEARYVTLVHELAHLYCGHLGTPNRKWWPDRTGLALGLREFEAESVCYLVCGRLGIDNPSEEYLAGYARQHEGTPPISLDCVMRAAWLIEQMGQQRLALRREEKAKA